MSADPAPKTADAIELVTLIDYTDDGPRLLDPPRRDAPPEQPSP